MILLAKSVYTFKAMEDNYAELDSGKPLVWGFEVVITALEEIGKYSVVISNLYSPFVYYSGERDFKDQYPSIFVIKMMLETELKKYSLNFKF